MLHRLISQFADEAVGNALLHLFLRYRNRPPVAGPAPADCPQIYTGELESFYAPAPQIADLCAQRRRLAETPRHTVWDFEFPSSVLTPWPRNNQVRGRHWQVRTGDRGLTVVGVHGIVQVGSLWFQKLAEQLHPHGVDVVMMDAPFNFRRTPAGYRPGQLIMGGDLAHQLAVARQGVLDLWRVIISLQAAGRRVGLVGASYGAWLSLMTSLVARPLDFVIALVPPVDIVALINEGGAVVRAIRRGLGSAPLDLEQIARLARPLIPSRWTPHLSGEAIVLHAARYDRFVPFHRVVQLAETWNTRLVVHNDAHLRLTFAGKITGQVADTVAEYWQGRP